MIFAEIQKNLHVVLIMDCTNSKFSVNCESNPAFFKQCAVQWLDSWSKDSMVKVSLPLLSAFIQFFRGWLHQFC